MANQTQSLSAEEAREIAREAYIYAYPLVLMDVTRQQLTNYAEPSGRPGQGPPNQFIHLREFPDPKFKIVIRPNADTLYSSAWLDLKAEPVVLSVPATDRYFMLPMLSMWSDVFAVPGTRTTGPNNARTFIVVGPGWSGNVPSGMELIKSPTRYVWFIGRTQTNGKADYDNVRKIQDGYKLTMLNGWGQSDYTPPQRHRRSECRHEDAAAGAGRRHGPGSFFCPLRRGPEGQSAERGRLSDPAPHGARRDCRGQEL
jgi:hypothetical protein